MIDGASDSCLSGSSRRDETPSREKKNRASRGDHMCRVFRDGLRRKALLDLWLDGKNIVPPVLAIDFSQQIRRVTASGFDEVQY